jgi:hypothetical protein
LKDPKKEKSPGKGSKLNKRMNLKDVKKGPDDTLDSRDDNLARQLKDKDDFKLDLNIVD